MEFRVKIYPGFKSEMGADFCIVKLRPLEINYYEGQDEWLLDTELEVATVKQFASSRNQKSMYIIM